MKIFSAYRKKMEPSRRFGSRIFRDKIKLAASYKRAFNPTSNFSLKFLPSGNKVTRASAAIGILIMLAAGFYLFVSPKLLITDVTIKGNVQVSNQQIQDVLATYANSRLFFIKKNNYFLMSRGRVNELLISNIPTIKEVVSYSRNWPSSATVQISEHAPGFVIESAGKYFLVDDEGTVVSQVPDTKKLLVANDQLVENFARDELLPNQKLAPFILSMNKLWSTKINVPITSVKFAGKSGTDVQFVTSTGWGALFDTTRSVTVQLSDLAVMLSKQIKPADQANLAYIDLRLSKWAYYCFKASPCQQQEQPLEAGIQTNVAQ